MKTPAPCVRPAVVPDAVVVPPATSSAVRWLYAAVGVACFVLGAVGAVVPGLPTTVFLLAGSYLLTRSCPWLERRLRDLPIFRRYAIYLDPGVPLPWAVKRRALAAMWLSIVIATSLLAWRGAVPLPVVIGIPLAGLVGSWVIVRFRRDDGTA
jgi:hypothetical protein